MKINRLYIFFVAIFVCFLGNVVSAMSDEKKELVAAIETRDVKEVAKFRDQLLANKVDLENVVIADGKTALQIAEEKLEAVNKEYSDVKKAMDENFEDKKIGYVKRNVQYATKLLVLGKRRSDRIQIQALLTPPFESSAPVSEPKKPAGGVSMTGGPAVGSKPEPKKTSEDDAETGAGDTSGKLKHAKKAKMIGKKSKTLPAHKFKPKPVNDEDKPQGSPIIIDNKGDDKAAPHDAAAKKAAHKLAEKVAATKKKAEDAAKLAAAKQDEEDKKAAAAAKKAEDDKKAADAEHKAKADKKAALESAQNQADDLIQQLKTIFEKAQSAYKEMPKANPDKKAVKATLLKIHDEKYWAKVTAERKKMVEDSDFKTLLSEIQSLVTAGTHLAQQALDASKPIADKIEEAQAVIEDLNTAISEADVEAVQNLLDANKNIDDKAIEASQATVSKRIEDGQAEITAMEKEAEKGSEPTDKAKLKKLKIKSAGSVIIKKMLENYLSPKNSVEKAIEELKSAYSKLAEPDEEVGGEGLGVEALVEALIDALQDLQENVGQLHEALKPLSA